MDEEDEHFLSASHRKCILLSGTECRIINYLLTELARAVPGNIGPRSFSYGPRCARSVLLHSPVRPSLSVSKRLIIFAANTSFVGKLLCFFWTKKPHFNLFLPITSLFLNFIYSSNYLCQTKNRYKTLPQYKLESEAWKSQNIKVFSN